MAKPITLYMDPEVVAELDSLAKAEDRSRNYVAIKFISRAFPAQGPIHEKRNLRR